MSKSADLAFHLIAQQRKVLPRARLDSALEQATKKGVPLEELLFDAGNLGVEDLEKIISIRERHGRACAACGEKTYLLPGDTPKKPCERCGGALLAP
ncbi:MAG: hypothetical protein KF878_21785, partial [Planctomycetes bacterium]|nr:hypothetical protein [Planctomycetota bacterium]